jgi:hypothetical protein
MAVTWTARTIGLLASIVRTVAAVIGGLILVHAVFVLFGANTHNVLVQFTAGIRDSFGWFTKDLFQPSKKDMIQAINDALAGFIWVFLGSLVAKFIARLAPASSGKDKSSKKKDDTPRSTPVQKSQPAEKPKQEAPKQAEEPKQEAPKQVGEPKQEEPKQEAPKQEAEPQREEPKQEAPKEKPAEEAPTQEEPAEESSAKHQARDTARDDERAADKAEA